MPLGESSQNPQPFIHSVAITAPECFLSTPKRISPESGMSGQLRPGLALPTPPPPSLPDAHLKGSMEVVIQRQDEVHVPCGPQEGWAAGVD